MSNTVWNRLRISGPKKAREDFLKMLQDKSWGLYYVNPKKEGEQSLGGEQHWMSKDPIDVHFTSGWGPPLISLEEMSADHPELNFYIVYAGQGPVYGISSTTAGRQIDLDIPDDPRVIKEIADDVTYKYNHETENDLAQRRAELAEDLMSGWEHQQIAQEIDETDTSGAYWWLGGIATALMILRGSKSLWKQNQKSWE